MAAPRLAIAISTRSTRRKYSAPADYSWHVPQNFEGAHFACRSNGGRDPWSGGGFLQPGAASTGNHWIFMERGAHHLDLRGPHADDPPEVTAARAQEQSIIRGWILAASRK
jgi:hypothetical protein